MKETVINKIIDKLFDDLNDRGGLHVDSIAKDVQEEIRNEWRKIIRKAVAKENNR